MPSASSAAWSCDCNGASSRSTMTRMPAGAHVLVVATSKPSDSPSRRMQRHAPVSGCRRHTAQASAGSSSNATRRAADATSSSRGDTSNVCDATTSAWSRCWSSRCAPCTAAMASSARRRSVMSRAIFDAPMIAPASLRIGDTVIEIGTSVPSLRRRQVSKWSTTSPLRIRRSTSSSSDWRSSGTISRIDLPMASAALYPKSRSAAVFHDVMTPSVSLLTMASSDHSTIAAS